MMRGLIAGLALAPLLLAGCGNADEGKTEDLREFLRQAHEFDQGYEELAELTYSDGDVTVDSSLEVNAELDQTSSSTRYCEWVSDWLYNGDNGTADSQVILKASGTHVMTRRGLSESCADVAFAARYGG